MLIKIKTTSLLSFKLRNPGKYKYTRHGVEGIYQTRCIEPTATKVFKIFKQQQKSIFLKLLVVDKSHQMLIFLFELIT